MANNILFKRIDNSPIIVFRIFFGLLMMIECWGSIATGWVTETFVDPKFTFTFIGFEWTNILLGETMYYVYIALGFLGLMIMLGLFYRISSFIFAIGWSLVYFMQKEHYNNHYYLVMLVSWIMIFIPANRYKSLDIILFPKIQSNWIYNWTRLIFILQLFILYTYAAIAKLYPGWINGDFLMIRYTNFSRWIDKTIAYEPITNFISSREFAQLFSWLGFGFDLLIVPLLLWKRTRVIALCATLFFHIFNSATLHIGIFPYFALSFSVFFFPPDLIRKIFFPKKVIYLNSPNSSYSKNLKFTLFTFLFWLYIGWQIFLPLRHWYIPGNVLWTEEGHRLSWRMMLRTKSANTSFYIVDKANRKQTNVKLNNYLTRLQQNRVQTRPDMIWQFAQYLKNEYAKKGREIEVYAKSRLSINRGPYHNYIDDTVDLASSKWNYFCHQSWILPEPKNYSKADE
ncbi:MAG: HTTM domain-containing protein [Moheibacter sp.]